MDVEKVGKAIAFLRKRAGYTQKDLADRIGISDKAVSKWERGLSLPDITYFGKLSILLDTDTDSLLTGDVIHHDKFWNGLLVLPENAYDIGAGTIIYDKPLVYYLLSYFLLVGVKTIYVVCSDRDKAYMSSELGDGAGLGITLRYCGQRYEDVCQLLAGAECSNIMAVFDRTLIYGVDQTRFFQRAMMQKDHLTILSLPQKHIASDEPSLFFDEYMQLVSSDSGEKVNTQYNYYKIPVLFCPRNRLNEICKNEGGRFSVSLAVNHTGQLYTEVLDRGYVEMRLNMPDNVIDASSFVRMVQRTCGMNIYCIEEIAWRRGMISMEMLREYGQRKSKTEYGRYLMSLCEDY